MKLIPCPINGPRPAQEFHYGGEVRVMPDPDQATDAEWADYVFMRPNSKGVLLERWVHSHGCRRWFNVARDTLTYKIHAVYKIGEKPPRVPKTDYV